ncbi:MAG: hypothetical protein EBU54_11990, partial [Mycobacteriaceae bacterium]|nr:hypothetical protein [Mycobacteriaceae bacterium]
MTQPTGAIRVCPASTEADSSLLSSRIRATTRVTGASGAIRPVVHATFSFADAAKAHALMESSQH